MAQFQNIALLSNETETEEPIQLHAGYYLFAAGLPSGETFPSSLKLQMRFKDHQGNDLPWLDTGTTLTSSDPTDVIYASPLAEYRMLANTAGAVVHYSQIKIPNG